MEQNTLIFKFIFIVFFLVLGTSVQSQQLIKGKAKVIDGDTIHIGNNKIRLHGIDAPETNQTCTIDNEIWKCGIESTKVLKNFILEKEVHCEIFNVDKYKRFIGKCFINKKDINQYMVKNGWAIAYRYYSEDYINEENTAKEKKLGIWKGLFIEPYIFRKKINKDQN
tara:strand:- start:514 stop:1014 length:501 start_codon:yes stop_codon:yes gene_type:complete